MVQQPAAAVVDEDDLVGGRVAVQFRLRLRPAGSGDMITSALAKSGTRPVTGSPAGGHRRRS